MASRTRPSEPKPAALTTEQLKRGITLLGRRIEELERFDPASAGDALASEVRVLETSLEQTLADIFSPDTLEYRRYRPACHIDDTPIIMGRGPAPASERRRYVLQGKASALLLLEQASRWMQERLADQEDAARLATARARDDFSAVFIAHGRDDGPREAVARFVSSLGLRPIILHERANKGRNVLTKLREEAAQVRFAVVLMTPDDVGGLQGEEQKPRARQNVVFELGFFIGVLGPDRVAALLKGDTERPSNFEGVVWIDLDAAGAWRQALAKELKAAGFMVDWNKVMED